MFQWIYRKAVRKAMEAELIELVRQIAGRIDDIPFDNVTEGHINYVCGSGLSTAISNRIQAEVAEWQTRRP